MAKDPPTFITDDHRIVTRSETSVVGTYRASIKNALERTRGAAERVRKAWVNAPTAHRKAHREKLDRCRELLTEAWELLEVLAEDLPELPEKRGDKPPLRVED